MTDAVVNEIAALLAGKPAEQETEAGATDGGTDDTHEADFGGSEAGEPGDGETVSAGDSESHQTDTQEADNPAPFENTLSALAERAGADVKDLYAVEVPLKDLVDEEGNPMTATIGQLKDAYAETQTIDAEREAVQQQRRDTERDLLTARSEMEAVIRMAGPNVFRPEVINTVRQQQRAAAEREAAKLKEIIPEWADETVQKQERTAMSELLANSGFSEAEIGNIMDARTINLVRRLMHAERRISKLDAEIETQRKQRVSRKKRGAAPKAGKGNQAQRVAQAKSGTTEQKVGAIAALIS